MKEEEEAPKPVKRRASVDFGAGSNKVHPAPNGLGSHSAAARASSKSKNASSLGSAFLDEPGHGKKERRKSAFQSAAENMLSDQQEGAKKPGGKWSLPLFFPNEPRYLRWLAYTMAVALVTAVLDPFNLAFVDNAGIYPYYDFWAVTDYVASATFVCDILTKFCLAYKDEQKGMVTDHKSIALRYLSFMFWVDMLVAAPLDGIIAGAMGIEMRDEDPRAQYIALVRWLKVGRLYRLFDLFALIEHKVLLSQFMLMLVRNSTYVFYIVHWLACILYYVARVDGFSENSWLGREDAQARIEGQHLWVKYLYSLYVAMGAFAGVGDEIFYVNSPAETIIMGLYLMLNIAIQAYILGTITIVMVKKDVESQAYRGSVTTLNEFADANELPKTLYTAMREHVELKFYSERTADEQVLQFYPSTIKRKVLRHLYMEVLKDCYLFHGCKARFLDQVLAAARMELFMPNVPILNEGDVCNELFLIVDGEVATSAPVDRTARRNSMMGPYDNGPNLDPEFLAGAQAAEDAADGEGGGFGAGLMRKARRVSALFIDPSALSGIGPAGGGGKNRRASNGSVAGSEKSEDAPGMMMKHMGKHSSMQSNGGSGNFGAAQSGNSFASSAGGTSLSGGMRNTSAIAVHRSSETFSEVPFFIEHPAVVDAWTKSVTRVLVINRPIFQELNKAFPQEVDTILKNLRNRCEGHVRTQVTEATLSRQLDAVMGDELHDVLNGKSFSTISEARMGEIKGSLTFAQRHALEEYRSVRKTLQDNLFKHDQMAVFKFLSAASMGDLDHVKSVIAKGRCLNITDYDGRSALMLAARENQEEVVDLLLRAGAQTGHVDSFGFTALYEAARMGHDDVMQLLLDYKAKLHVDSKITTPALFAAVKAGQAGQVRRFTQVGVSPDCRGFYDRTPLHLAASLGSLSMVRTLVEDAGAQIEVEDMFKRTPVQDAESAGHLHVATYLKAALRQSRRDSSLLVPEMERLSDTGMFAPVPVPIKPMNILPKRPASAASNRSSSTAHRRALRAASPVLSWSSHGSRRSIGVYRKTVMDTANNCSPASVMEGGSQGQAPGANAGLPPRTNSVSRAAAAAAAARAEAAAELSSDDGSENSSRGSLPTSVRLSPEPRMDEVPQIDPKTLRPPSTQPGHADTGSRSGGGGGDGTNNEVTPFTLASNPRAPEAWLPPREPEDRELEDRMSVRPAPPPIVPAEISALYSISVPTSQRTSLPALAQPTLSPKPSHPPPPAESQHLTEESLQHLIESGPLPVAPPTLRPRNSNHPAHDSPQPSATAAAPAPSHVSSSSHTREPAALPTPTAGDALPGAASPGASPNAPPSVTSASAHPPQLQGVSASPSAAGAPLPPERAAASRETGSMRAVGSGREASSPASSKSRTGTPVPPLDFSAIRAHHPGSPTHHTNPHHPSESRSSAAADAVAEEHGPSQLQLQQQRRQQQQQQQEISTARDLESVPEPAWQGRRGVPPPMWGVHRGVDGKDALQQQQPEQYAAVGDAGPRASTAAVTDRPRGLDDAHGMRHRLFAAGAAPGAFSARMPHGLTPTAGSSNGAAGLGVPQLQQPMVPAGARRISQLIREEQAWSGSSSGGRGPPEGQSNSGLPTGLAPPPGRPMSVPHSLLNMPMNLPYPAGNTSRASYRAPGTSTSVPSMPGLHSNQPSHASGASPAVPGPPPLSTRPSTTSAASPLPTRASGSSANALPAHASGTAAPPLPTCASGSSANAWPTHASGTAATPMPTRASGTALFAPEEPPAAGPAPVGLSNGDSGGGNVAEATPPRPRAPADLPWTGSPGPPSSNNHPPSLASELQHQQQQQQPLPHQDLPYSAGHTSRRGSMLSGRNTRGSEQEHPTNDSANSMRGGGRASLRHSRSQQQQQQRPGSSSNPRDLASQPSHGSVHNAHIPSPEIVGDTEMQQLAPPSATPHTHLPHHNTSNSSSHGDDSRGNPLAHSSDTALHEVSQLVQEPGVSRPGSQSGFAQAGKAGSRHSMQAPEATTLVNRDELDLPPPPSLATPAVALSDQQQQPQLQQQQQDGVAPSSEHAELEGTALLGSVHRGSLVLQPSADDEPLSSPTPANPAAQLSPGRPIATPRGGRPRTSLDVRRLQDQPLPPSSRGARQWNAVPTTGDVDSLIQEMRESRDGEQM